MILDYYLTANYSCSYIHDRQARSLVLAKGEEITQELYNKLVEAGFRRSGAYIYRANCDACNACKASRISVKNFEINKTQRKILRKNTNLTVRIVEVRFSEERLALYRSYVETRHHSPGQQNQELTDDFVNSMLKTNVETRLIEFRNGDELKICSLVDFVHNGISAVYTFYELSKDNSLGTYSILWLINFCREKKLDYLYLGYLIDECKKMSYKGRFRAVEILDGGKWIPKLDDNIK